MASLYIKDSEVARLAREVAELRGITKTAAVKEALRKEREALGSARPAQGGDSLLARLDEFRRHNPLPPPTGLKADKAFFDRLWGEE